MRKNIFSIKSFFAPLAQIAMALMLFAITGCSGQTVSESQPSPVTRITLDSFPPMPSGPAPGASQEMRALVASMGRGINFGNMLEAPREGDWGLRAETRFIELVGDGKFTKHVRLPVRWSNHASLDAAAIIDPKFFERVDSVVDALLARGVTVMLDMHHYRQIDGDARDENEPAVAPDVVNVRLLSMWRQIAQRYANRSSKLLFEVYNEPHGVLEPAWNDLLSRAVRVIRESNPTRAIVIGPTSWNSASRLSQLSIPPDANLILTVHIYDPFSFTHQGADWITPKLPTGVTCCNEAQKQEVNKMLDLAVSEAKRLNYPVFVGEFGSYERAPQPSRIEYSRFMRQAMEARALPWFYWELASGFGVYDPVANSFRKDLFDALYGP
jgi:endoglucanase